MASFPIVDMSGLPALSSAPMLLHREEFAVGIDRKKNHNLFFYRHAAVFTVYPIGVTEREVV